MTDCPHPDGQRGVPMSPPGRPPRSACHAAHQRRGGGPSGTPDTLPPPPRSDVPRGDTMRRENGMELMWEDLPAAIKAVSGKGAILTCWPEHRRRCRASTCELTGARTGRPATLVEWQGARPLLSHPSLGNMDRRSPLWYESFSPRQS